ncbi:MAG: hypothetical protein VB021_05670 [Oscillospiraceae bacterium]|nr:hypothetical protein [Oscillospiraceae bacterium]
MANEFFDQVITKSKELADAVAKTTGELVDKGKIKAAQLQTKGDVKEQYRKLGELAYCSAKNGACDEEARTATVAKIDELLAKLASLDAQLAAKPDEKPAETPAAPTDPAAE